ncbi:hypothetical protein FUAX_49590 (plasmid) [Fulvitalea axinellae]|uniref:ABM domain-containing protein n=1 Tax=Fulvitalea axinellae TaxID=1182444 RepID=A0AAU9D018_9BACT|nr:hypothetical protein FUAX_49590 [Fulvitalea axinellae]
MKKAYRITYIKVKPGREKDFGELRKIHEEELNRCKSLIYGRLFKSFFSFPQSKARNAYVELNEWSSEATMREGERTVKSAIGYEEYTDTFEVEASFRMIPQGENEINLSQMIQEGYAIEFASRQIKPAKRKVYPERRAGFMRFIKRQPGFVFDQEFSSLDEDIDILVFAWKSVEDFRNAGNKVKRSFGQLFKTIRYFGLIKQKAFQVGTVYNSK